MPIENEQDLVPRICILIRAGEGDTRDVFIGRSKEDLIENIHSCFQKQQDENQKIPDDIEYHKNEEKSFCEMLNKHRDWVIGRYILENTGSIWEECTLIIEKY